LDMYLVCSKNATKNQEILYSFFDRYFSVTIMAFALKNE